MKIAAISGVKNEADIIESFVRHNAKYIDDFYFIDDSVDNTREILRLLAQEGFRISLINLDTRDYQHSQIMTNATRLVGTKAQYDWIFYLDGDEILASESQEQFHKVLELHEGHSVGNLLMEDYGFNGNDYYASANPLKECFNKNINNVTRQKIFVRGSESQHILIGVGQHNAFNQSGELIAYFESGIRIAHFPSRSPAQWVTRNILRYSGLIAKLNRFPGEGSHVIDIFNSLKDSNFEIAHHQFVDWGNLSGSTPEFLDDVVCRYQDLARINERQILGLEIERQANLLSDYRHKIFAAASAAKQINDLQSLLSLK